MTPFQFLLLIVVLTGGAVVADALSRRVRRRRLAEIARQSGMHYSPPDLFHLASQMPRRLTVPGAADISVRDVVYGVDDGHHRYIFTVEYTLGVIRTKRRVTRVATFREPKAHSDPTQRPAVEFAPQDLPILEQYRTLLALHAVPVNADKAT